MMRESGRVAESLGWIEIGDPPASVNEARDARLKRFLPAFSILGAVILGGSAGFAATEIWPGAISWPFNQRVELYVTAAVVVGVADYFFNRRMIPWVARAATLRVRRLSITGGKLCIDQGSGKPYEVALSRLRISSDPVVEGWYSVTIEGGEVPHSFFVPSPVATNLSSYIPGHSRAVTPGSAPPGGSDPVEARSRNGR